MYRQAGHVAAAAACFMLILLERSALPMIMLYCCLTLQKHRSLVDVGTVPEDLCVIAALSVKVATLPEEQVQNEAELHQEKDSKAAPSGSERKLSSASHSVAVVAQDSQKSLNGHANGKKADLHGYLPSIFSPDGVKSDHGMGTPRHSGGFLEMSSSK